MYDLCTNHSAIHAVNNCAVCRKPFCIDCLEVSNHRAVCKGCLGHKFSPLTALAVIIPGLLITLLGIGALAALHIRINGPGGLRVLFLLGMCTFIVTPMIVNYFMRRERWPDE